VVLTTHPI